jgi:Acetyltransferase (GNAT) domain
MRLYEIDPIGDRRWLDLVGRSSVSSVFHTPDWLKALQRTYAYKPVAFTHAPPGENLRNALLFCRVDSWMTGRRLVSLPFSDHCEPLVDSPGALASLVQSLNTRMCQEGRAIELRWMDTGFVPAGLVTSAVYCLQSIDLRPELDVIFAKFHKNHVQRTIRKAERMGVTLEKGRSATLLAEFYALHVMTRLRLGAPIQPFVWFQNLTDCLGERLQIYAARVDGRPIAAILTTKHRTTLVYKYGCSDLAYKRFGANPLLFWTAIQDAKREGIEAFDLGRSDIDNEGLIAFKDHLGARRATLNYYSRAGSPPRSRWATSLARACYAVVPPRIQTRVGSVLYKHFG